MRRPLAPRRTGHTTEVLTVIVAFAANLLVAIAKSGAALLTGSAAMVAEAAHSWADAGNEIFLVVARRRSQRPSDERHPAGFGREAYVWSMFAAIGLFAVGASVSVLHGVQELRQPETAEHFWVAYAVLGVSAVLEGISFLQALHEARRSAAGLGQDVIEHVLETSDPTLRGVFAEDAAALVGCAIAAVAVALHQATGSALPDAIGSILVGVLLAGVALMLIDRNRRFLVGEAVDPRLRQAAGAWLVARPEIEKVTYLHLEYSGPRQVAVLARVDMADDLVESTVAERMAQVEDALEAHAGISQAVLAPARPGTGAVFPSTPTGEPSMAGSGSDDVSLRER